MQELGNNWAPHHTLKPLLKRTLLLASALQQAAGTGLSNPNPDMVKDEVVNPPTSRETSGPKSPKDP